MPIRPSERSRYPKNRLEAGIKERAAAGTPLLPFEVEAYGTTEEMSTPRSRYSGTVDLPVERLSSL